MSADILRFINDISTHALTEGDVVQVIISALEEYFNSRPHGGRLLAIHFHRLPKVFQLTPSRRAT